jgi:hypothetical protein
MNTKELIIKILKEEIEIPVDNDKQLIDDLVKDYGMETAIKYLGGIDNYINIRYDGDLIKFSEETTTPIARISEDGLDFYLHEALVNELGLKDVPHSSKGEKLLGNFKFGSKTSTNYLFTAYLYPTRIPRIHNQTYYRVVGTSGDSGFGYNFIKKRDILGKRYRQQIFKQIMDKYDLTKYMKVKTFY